MTGEFIKTAISDGVLSVLVDREPKRNALSLSVLGELHDAFAHHAANDSLIVAVVRGAGDRCFAAGGDLRELDSGALNGDALGGGAEFAVACDMRLFARHARIAFVQGKLCVSPAWGGGIDLMRLVGPANALRLFSRAEFIDAETALTLGIAQAVAAEGETFEAAIERFLEPIKAMSPQVMRAFKALTRAQRDGAGARELREVEIEGLLETWLHDDHWNAAAAVQAGIDAKR